MLRLPVFEARLRRGPHASIARVDEWRRLLKITCAPDCCAEHPAHASSLPDKNPAKSEKAGKVATWKGHMSIGYEPVMGPAAIGRSQFPTNAIIVVLVAQ